MVTCVPACALAKMGNEYLVDSCVRGYHYYQNIWDPLIYMGKFYPAFHCGDENPHDKKYGWMAFSSRLRYLNNWCATGVHGYLHEVARVI